MVSALETLAPGACGRLSSSCAQLTFAVVARPLEETVAAVLAAHRSALQLSQRRGSSWLHNLEYSAATGADVSSERVALEALADAVKRLDEGTSLTPLAAAPTKSCDNLLLCDQDTAAVLSTPTGAPLLASFISGFQLAANAGPLCEERLSGVMFVLESLEVSSVPVEELNSGRLAGQSIAAMKDACRGAILTCPTRLLEPVYKCELQTTQDMMGRAYAVLSRRRARVLAEEMREGTPIFMISAYLPVAESFGFAGELRKTTSGAAHPQLVFSHYEAMAQDPLFVVVTEEDQEALDDGKLPSINIARSLMNDVRRRKGLLVEEDRVVQSATKQRTLARKK